MWQAALSCTLSLTYIGSLERSRKHVKRRQFVEERGELVGRQIVKRRADRPTSEAQILGNLQRVGSHAIFVINHGTQRTTRKRIKTCSLSGTAEKHNS